MLTEQTARKILALLTNGELQEVGFAVMTELAKREMLFVFDFSTDSLAIAEGRGAPPNDLAVCLNDAAVKSSIQVNCRIKPNQQVTFVSPTNPVQS